MNLLISDSETEAMCVICALVFLAGIVAMGIGTYLRVQAPEISGVSKTDLRLERFFNIVDVGSAGRLVEFIGTLVVFASVLFLVLGVLLPLVHSHRSQGVISESLDNRIRASHSSQFHESLDREYS